MDDLFLYLIAQDKALFLYLNNVFATPLLDDFFVWITRKKSWYIPGGLIWLYLIWKGGKQGRILAASLVLGLVLSDQISSSILKPSLERFRPCKSLEGFRLLVHCGSKYGFPSSHASNVAVVATLFSLNFRKWAPIWVILAFLIGVSRIYVGVHFPGDVLAGWGLGILVGVLLVWGGKRFWVVKDVK